MCGYFFAGSTTESSTCQENSPIAVVSNSGQIPLLPHARNCFHHRINKPRHYHPPSPSTFCPHSGRPSLLWLDLLSLIEPSAALNAATGQEIRTRKVQQHHHLILPRARPPRQEDHKAQKRQQPQRPPSQSKWPRRRSLLPPRSRCHSKRSNTCHSALRCGRQWKPVRKQNGCQHLASPRAAAYGVGRLAGRSGGAWGGQHARSRRQRLTSEDRC